MMKRIFINGLAFLIVLGLVSSALFVLKEQRRWAPDPAGDLPGKTAFYLAHIKDFDLVFLGDSRTYCAMHPEVLDPLLGTRSFNLAHWAHWLPTQYAHVQDILPALPPGTTLVWSVGETNFQPNAIYDKYPLGLANAWRMLQQGYTAKELAENLMTFNPTTFLYAYRGVLLNHALALAAQPLEPAQARAPRPGPAVDSDAQTIPPGVLRSQVQAPGGKPVGVSRFMTGGGYLLEELDPAHFQALQSRERTTDGTPALDTPFRPDSSRWASFLAILDLLRSQNAHVVVNVLEEAPHMYASKDALARVRAFMDGPVREAVTAHGFVYLRTDLDALTDAEYFDYDHLNSRGVEKFSALFARALAPHLLPAARP